MLFQKGEKICSQHFLRLHQTHGSSIPRLLLRFIVIGYLAREIASANAIAPLEPILFLDKFYIHRMLCIGNRICKCYCSFIGNFIILSKINRHRVFAFAILLASAIAPSASILLLSKIYNHRVLCIGNTICKCYCSFIADIIIAKIYRHRVLCIGNASASAIAPLGPISLSAKIYRHRVLCIGNRLCKCYCSFIADMIKTKIYRRHRMLCIGNRMLQVLLLLQRRSYYRIRSIVIGCCTLVIASASAIAPLSPILLLAKIYIHRVLCIGNTTCKCYCSFIADIIPVKIYRHRVLCFGNSICKYYSSFRADIIPNKIYRHRVLCLGNRISQVAI